ncbi:MAG: Fur family transcriptional regulator [Phycisphaerales bacterium]|nr:Fur family transcriptional regulator [Phycisphaerales bacterium]
MVSREYNTTQGTVNEPGEKPFSPESLRSRLRSEGLRCTPQRLAVYQTLCASSHPTAEELHAAVSKEMAMSLATVYNTLDLFSSAGLILRIPSKSGSFRYCGGQRSHMHFQFQGSDQMMDVPADLGEKIMESIPASILSEIEDRMGVRIDSVDVQLKGARAESAPSTDS